MLRRTALLMAIAAGVALAQVQIRPPGPYMSSPPPPVDTTPLDPNRRPTVEIAPVGVQEQWYGDWNLVTDKSPSGPIQVSAPRKGELTFRATFDSRGWITELVHYDARRKERWTKLFTYPARIPAGPGEVPVTITWSRADGSLFDLKALEANIAKGVPPTTRKLDLLDLLGEPFLVVPEADRGETWVYATAKEERRFRYDRKGKLQEDAPLAPATPPAVTPTATDTPATPAP